VEGWVAGATAAAASAAGATAAEGSAAGVTAAEGSAAGATAAEGSAAGVTEAAACAWASAAVAAMRRARACRLWRCARAARRRLAGGLQELAGVSGAGSSPLRDCSLHGLTQVRVARKVHAHAPKARSTAGAAPGMQLQDGEPVIAGPSYSHAARVRPGQGRLGDVEAVQSSAAMNRQARERAAGRVEVAVRFGERGARSAEDGTGERIPATGRKRVGAARAGAFHEVPVASPHVFPRLGGQVPEVLLTEGALRHGAAGQVGGRESEGALRPPQPQRQQPAGRAGSSDF
jgi:hypothetical protein